MSLPPNEIERLAELSEYDILDTPSERLYDGLVQLASLITQTPMAALSFMARDRAWVKGKIGLDACETQRELTFCDSTIHSAAPVVVEDARQDSWFAKHPHVVGEPHIVFYAGIPLITPQGFPIGTLCVIDTEPRQLSEAQLDGLKEIAQQAMAHLEHRRTKKRLAMGVRMRQRELETSTLERSRLMSFLDQAPLVTFIKDSSDRYVYVNQAFELRHGLNRTDVIGLDDDHIFPAEVATQNWIEDSAVREQKRVITCYDAVDDRIWLTHRFPVESGMGGVSVDISTLGEFERQVEQYVTDLSDAQIQMELQHRELQQLADTDGLTGLLNHRAMQERLEHEMVRAQVEDIPLSFVLMDLDLFKSYNDAFGHPAGDEVLRQVSEILRQTLRPTDVVARYGGEELAAILPRTDARGAAVVAERLREAVSQAPWPHRPITISAGAATYQPETDDKESFIKRTDDALYEAKAQGRNQTRLAA